MPRKRARHTQSEKSLPFPFSPFARSIAQVASANKGKRRMHDPNVKRKAYPHSAAGGSIKHSLEEKSEYPESSDEEVSDGVVQADFAFFDPKSNDFHGVKNLLQTYLDDKQWDLSGFVDLILGQSTVGTVVKIEDDEDNGLFSVITSLNLGRYKDNKCIKEIKEYLLGACQSREVMQHLRLLLGEEAKSVGLLVSQRVMNLPPQLLPPLYDALFDEILWATEDEPTEELRDSFGFKFYLMVSRIYKHKDADQKHRPSRSSDEETVLYVKPEDELFHKLSTRSFTFPLHKLQPAPHELRNYRLTGLVMAVEADKVSKFRQQLHSLVDESG